MIIKLHIRYSVIYIYTLFYDKELSFGKISQFNM